MQEADEILSTRALADGRQQRRNPQRATISVEWGYELHSITLTVRNWAKVMAGKPLRIRGEGYWSDGEHYWAYWSFAGGLEGMLMVSYHRGTKWYGDGWLGPLNQAEIEIFNE